MEALGQVHSHGLRFLAVPAFYSQVIMSTVYINGRGRWPTLDSISLEPPCLYTHPPPPLNACSVGVVYTVYSNSYINICTILSQ